MEDKKRALEEMIEVLVVAIPREISAYEFYMSASRKSVNDASRELFVSLAHQEKGHEAALRGIMEELKKELEELKKK